jgi:hypothetical protein
MARRTSALLVLALGGCSTYRQSSVAAQAGGLLSLGGIGLVAAGLILCPPVTECTRPLGNGFLAVGLISTLGGIPLTLGGLVGMAIHDKPADKEQPPAEPTTPDPACLEVRRRKLREAQAIADPKQRGAALLAVPVCEPMRPAS